VRASSRGVEVGQQHVDQALVVGFTQLRVADQTLDALPFPPELLQQLSVFLSISALKLHPDPLCQRRAMPAGGNRDLQRTAMNDGGGDEITGVRRIDDVHPNVTSPSSLAHGPIHGTLIGGSDDQRAVHHVGLTEGARLILYDPLCGKAGEGCAEPGADHDHHRARLKKPLHFAGGDFPAADHQTALVL
jgi:hypothetical protein